MKQAPKQKQMRYDDLRKAKQKLIEEYGSITYQELTLHDLRAFINLDAVSYTHLPAGSGKIQCRNRRRRD